MDVIFDSLMVGTGAAVIYGITLFWTRSRTKDAAKEKLHKRPRNVLEDNDPLYDGDDVHPGTRIRE